jgi:hypothetical protein
MKFIRRILLWGLGGILVALILAYNGFVHYRFSQLPENRNPTPVSYPERIQKIFWAAKFNGKPMRIEPMPFWKWAITLIKELRTDKHERVSPNQRAVSEAGKALLFRENYNPTRTTRFQLDWLFASIWVSKHWSAEEVVNTLLAHSYFGGNFYGLEAASKGYFDVTPEELTGEEMAFLSGVTQAPARYNPWSQPANARKGAATFLQRAAQNGIESIGKDPELCFKRLKQSPEINSENQK